jgi:hypothetical protein
VSVPDYDTASIAARSASGIVGTPRTPLAPCLHHRTGSGDKEKVTPMTAINAYISPDLLRQFFGKLKLRVPDWVPKT